jgi:hypothetical protein
VTTIRVARRRKFTSVDRAAVNDSRLSFRARGVLVWLLDKPDDWTTNADKITAAGKEGRDATRAALHELEGCGYLTRRRWRDDSDGKYHSEWTVRERPAGAEPLPISSAGFPPTDNRRGFSRPLTEDEEPKTDLTKLRLKATKDCPSCHGLGYHYHAGAGVDAPCACTFRTKESV